MAWPIKTLLRKVLGEQIYQECRATFLHTQRGLGLDWRWCNSLRTVYPIRRDFGWQAGQTIDRYYTENVFLSRYADDVQGHVLEVGDGRYTKRFGEGKVSKSDVLNVKPGSMDTTIVAVSYNSSPYPSNTFDCAILTFTLQFIYDVKSALDISTSYSEARRGRARGGAWHDDRRYDDDNWGDYWKFTSRSVRMLFEQCFRPEFITIQAYGNVLSALASLHGLISSELTREELDHRDKDYELVITVRAVKEHSHLQGLDVW